MFKFITSKPLWVNILAGLVLVLVLVLIFFSLLDWITGHGKYEKVPSVIGLNIDAARLSLMSQGFTVEVSDSVYDSSVGALSVVKQSPEADALVKHGRTIYLSVNRASAPLVEMPNLVGYSFRSAQMYLATLGLKLGDTTYQPDIARNSVLEQYCNNQIIKPGTKIPQGSIISLVLGSGVGSGELNVPDLIGLTLAQARDQLKTLNLNLGSVIPMDEVKDTANAFIVKQSPEVTLESEPGQKVINKISPGQTIDVYISVTAPVRDTTLNSKP